MKSLKPHQIVAVLIAAVMGVALAYLFFNMFQAICFGVMVGVITYSYLLSRDEKKPPEDKF